MIIDVNFGDRGDDGWHIYRGDRDPPERMERIIWINDKTAEFAQAVFPLVTILGPDGDVFFKHTLFRANKIVIDPYRKTVVINPTMGVVMPWERLQ